MTTHESAHCPEPALRRYGEYQELKIHWRNGILSVGLNRPRKRNAIGVEMTLELERICAAALQDTRLKTMIVHGVGGHFCAGMDMKDFFDHSDQGEDVLRRARVATDNWRARLLRRIQCPIISVVQGYCLGGALPILECSDIVLATSDAVFGMPEINFGFVPGGPIAKSLINALPPRAASYVALTGRPFDAMQAFRWGLVSEVVDDADPLLKAQEMALHIAAQGDADPSQYYRTEEPQ